MRADIKLTPTQQEAVDCITKNGPAIFNENKQAFMCTGSPHQIQTQTAKQLMSKKILKGKKRTSRKQSSKKYIFKIDLKEPVATI